MLENFTTRELHDVARAHDCRIKCKKADALKVAKSLLRSSDGQLASATVMAIQQTKCQIDLSDKNTIKKLVEQLTRDLDSNPLQPQFDDQQRMIKPKLSAKYYFDDAFWAACNKKGNICYLKEAIGYGWDFIGVEGRQRWLNAHVELVKTFDEYLIEDKGKQSLNI